MAMTVRVPQRTQTIPTTRLMAMLLIAQSASHFWMAPRRGIGLTTVGLFTQIESQRGIQTTITQFISPKPTRPPLSGQTTLLITITHISQQWHTSYPVTLRLWETMNFGVFKPMEPPSILHRCRSISVLSCRCLIICRRSIVCHCHLTILCRHLIVCHRRLTILCRRPVYLWNMLLHTQQKLRASLPKLETGW